MAIEWPWFLCLMPVSPGQGRRRDYERPRSVVRDRRLGVLRRLFSFGATAEQSTTHDQAVRPAEEL